MTFNEFKSKVDEILIDRVGLTCDDMADVDLWDYFDPDLSVDDVLVTEYAHDAAMHVLDYNDAPAELID